MKVVKQPARDPGYPDGRWRTAIRAFAEARRWLKETLGMDEGKDHSLCQLDAENPS